MKIALQENLLPGDSLDEKLDFAESIEIEGMEVGKLTTELEEAISTYEKALAGRSIKISTVCTQPHFDWLDPDLEKRRVAIQESKMSLTFCGHFGAVGHIVPPIFGPPRLPDLSPLDDAISLEKKLLVEIVKEIAAHAHSAGTLLLLEPLNRYEQHLLRRQADGVEIIQRAGDPPGVALISDFFHMHIEETNTPDTLREVGNYIAHIHMADNTRLQPGTGDIDWHAGLQALQDIGYDGYLAYECGIMGEPRQSLRESVAFVRSVLASLA